MLKIIEVLEAIPDERSRHKIKHPLSSLLFTSICAIFCGAESWEDIPTWAESNLDWLSSHVDMQNGVASYSTFRRMFMFISSKHFTTIAQHAIGLHNPNKSPEDQVAIDGKTLRGSKCKAKSVGAVQLVSALSIANDIILGEISTDSKSNEITAIPLLLELLELSGTTVSIDAIACNEKIITEILKQDAHYLIGLKKNQPTLYKAVEEYAQSHGTVRDNLIEDHFDHSHGRCTRRRYFAFDAPEAIKKLGFSNMNTIIATETISSSPYLKESTVTAEWRYYITDHVSSNMKLSDYVRSHWNIESSHWMLDVHLGDDKDKKHDKIATENFAKVRRMLLNLVKSKHPPGKKRSVRSRLKQVGWNLNYLVQLLFG